MIDLTKMIEGWRAQEILKQILAVCNCHMREPHPLSNFKMDEFEGEQERAWKLYIDIARVLDQHNLIKEER